LVTIVRLPQDCGPHATTNLVARHHGRHSIGIELNETYLEIAAKRLQQLSLLA
jgi:DNA modification methylase